MECEVDCVQWTLIALLLFDTLFVIFELFIDIEGGVVQPQATSVKAASASGIGISMPTIVGSAASVELWRMHQSVY